VQYDPKEVESQSKRLELDNKAKELRETNEQEERIQSAHEEKSRTPSVSHQWQDYHQLNRSGESPSDRQPIPPRFSIPGHPLDPPPTSPTGSMIPRHPISREAEAAAVDAPVNQPTVPHREAANRPFNQPLPTPDQLSIARQPVSMDRRPGEKEGFTSKEPATAPRSMMQNQGMPRVQLDYQRGMPSVSAKPNIPGVVGNRPSEKEQPVQPPQQPRPAFAGVQGNQEFGGIQYRTTEKPIPALPVSQEGRAEDQSKVIMVVDDSQTVRNIMALILHRAGYRSIRVSSAMEALHTLTELVPDLIFLDITLPGMDGLDVCKIIKENPRTKQVPVVMLSGNNEIFDKVMGRLAGASDYITKPFEPEVILNCIKSFLGQKKSLREWLWQGVR